MVDSGWHCPAMPWAEVDPMHQRILFVEAARGGRFSMTELCALFGVSRQTGYKWLARANEGGTKALTELSRRPHSNSAAIADEVAERLVAARKAHPTWGARKLIAWLAAREPDLELPAASTVTELLKRRGLVKPRRLRQRLPPRSQPLAHATAPNVVWSVDFKGDFRVGDGTKCYPLTVTDACSRALLCCQALNSPGGKGVQATLEKTFRRWGLPRYLRSDNGPPFGTMRTGPLSRLSVWLLKVGVLPEYIDPGKPQQNGRHERFHLTLKQDTALPPSASLRAQQRRFDAFRREYNQERPHESLGMLPPALMHRPSYRAFPSRVTSPEYPGHYEVRRVTTRGSFVWRSRETFLAETLAGEPIGLVESQLGWWEIYYGPVVVGRLHEALQGRIVRPKVSAMSPV